MKCFVYLTANQIMKEERKGGEVARGTRIETKNSNQCLLSEKGAGADDSETLYWELFNSNPIPMWIYNRETLSFLEVNKAAIEQYGYSREEFLVMTILDIRPATEVEKLISLGGRLNRSGKVEKAFWKHKKKDGQLIDVEITAQLMKYRNHAAALVLATDVTERKQVQFKLERTNRRLKIAQQIGKMGYWEVNLSSKQWYWSDETFRILGWTKGMLTPDYEMFLSMVHPDDRNYYLLKQKEILGAGQSMDAEYRLILRNGKIKYVHTRSTVIYDEEGKAASIEGILQDVTDRRKTEEEMLEMNLQLKELSRHLQCVREEERRYLAREVHDELGQLASAVKMDVDWLYLKTESSEEKFRSRAAQASATCDLMISTIRKIASDLRPGMLDELGLNASLEWKCNRFAQMNGIACDFYSNVDEAQLDSFEKTELFRICQESLTNVLRHAKATKVTITLTDKGDVIRLLIADDGCGFDTMVKTHHLGLIGMKERAISINGKFIITSQPGLGTVINVTLPSRNSTSEKIND